MTKKQVALIKLIEKYSGKKVTFKEFANDRNVRTKLGKGNVPAEAANLTEDEGGFGIDKEGGLEMTSDSVIKNKDKVMKMANDGLDIEITDMQEAKKKIAGKRKILKESPVQDVINWVVQSWNDTTIPHDAWGESSMTNGEIFRSYVYTFLGMAGLSIITFKSEQWIKALKQAPGKIKKIVRLAKLFASGKATPESVKAIGIDVPPQTIEANAQRINEAFKRKAKIKKLTQLIEAKTGKKVVFESPKKKVIKEADSIEDLPNQELYLLSGGSVINTTNPLKNELVSDWDKEKGEGMCYFLCRNIIIAGSGRADFYGKVGSLFFLFDDGNKTTKFPKAWSTIRVGGRTKTIRASKWNGLQVSIQAVANNAEEIKNFPPGKYKLYVMK
jgi:hypothetical protein